MRSMRGRTDSHKQWVWRQYGSLVVSFGSCALDSCAVCVVFAVCSVCEVNAVCVLHPYLISFYEVCTICVFRPYQFWFYEVICVFHPYLLWFYLFWFFFVVADAVFFNFVTVVVANVINILLRLKQANLPSAFSSWLLYHLNAFCTSFYCIFALSLFWFSLL